MEFKFGNFAIVLPSLHFTIITVIIFIFLVKWSRQLETGRFKIFLYFLISTYIAPIYSHGTEEGVFELWLPLGFIIILFYFLRSKTRHSSKIKASILGLCIALYS